MPGGPERDALLGLRGVGPLVVVGVEETPDVDQDGGVRQLARGWIHFHLHTARPRPERRKRLQQDSPDLGHLVCARDPSPTARSC